MKNWWEDELGTASKYSSKQKELDLYDSWKGGSGHSSVGFKHARCYESHKPMKLPGSDRVVHGGSCCSPAVKDADVYIGFDSGMQFTRRHYPWNDGVEVFFKITDMSAPDNPDEFRKLVEWAKEQIDSGKKVHAGCIGGHGRTGTFLAALVSLYGEPDAISYVRKNYCDKAVESDSQVKFLQKHFGITAAKGAKSYGKSSASSHSFGSSSKSGKGKKGGEIVPYQRAPSSSAETYTPVATKACIWGMK